MKKTTPLITCLILAFGCSASSPDNLPSMTSKSQPESFYGWENFSDLSGEKIDFSSEDVKILEINYGVGWNFDSSDYKKILRGNLVGGFNVNTILSNYFIQYNKDHPPIIICNQNQYWLDSSDSISGILVVNQDGISFYAYYNENKQNFLFVCERNENSEREFLEKSIISVSEGKTVHVQPIRICSADRTCIY